MYECRLDSKNHQADEQDLQWPETGLSIELTRKVGCRKWKKETDTISRPALIGAHADHPDFTRRVYTSEGELALEIAA